MLLWEWPLPLVAAWWAIYTVISAAYFSSTLSKVPQGAWAALLVAALLSAAAAAYHWGQQTKAVYVRAHAVKLSDLLEEAAGAGGGAKGGGARAPGADGDGDGADAEDKLSVRSAASTVSSGGRLVALHPGLQRLRLVGTGLPVGRVPGVGIYYSELLTGVTPSLVRFLSLSPTVHEAVVLLTIRRVPVPHVRPVEQLLVR